MNRTHVLTFLPHAGPTLLVTLLEDRPNTLIEVLRLVRALPHWGAKRSGIGSALIPADVRTFLLEHIDSIAQLEALVLPRGTPTECWSAETLAKRPYIPA